MEKFIIIIPAYEPDDRLCEFESALLQQGRANGNFYGIIIVTGDKKVDLVITPDFLLRAATVHKILDTQSALRTYCKRDLERPCIPLISMIFGVLIFYIGNFMIQRFIIYPAREKL